MTTRHGERHSGALRQFAFTFMNWQLHNSLDPSPFWDNLDRNAAEFIEGEFCEHRGRTRGI
jgi:hypothetical protein